MLNLSSFRPLGLWLVTLLLFVGCGGGGGGTSQTLNATSATTGEPITVDLSRSTLTVNKTQAVADGSDQIVATFTARDQNGRPVVGLAITVQVTGTGNVLTQPAPTDANGVTRATLVSTVAEGKTVTAVVDGQVFPISAVVTFVSGTASQLTLRTPPPSEIVQGAVLPTVVVAVEDQFGNLVTSSGLGSMSVSASPVPGELSGPLSQSVVNGFASFDSLSLSGVGAGRALTFQLGNLSVSSNGINVTAIPPSTNKLVFTASPSGSVAAGDSNLGSITVKLKDENDVDIARAGVSVELTVSTGPGSLEGTTSGTTDASGLATFQGLSLKTAGTYALTAVSSDADFPNPSTTASFSVVADAANAGLMFTAAPEGVISVGSEFSAEVRVVDPFGNLVEPFSDSLTLELSNTTSVPVGLGLMTSGSLTIAPSNGVAGFSALRVDGNFNTTESGYFLRVTSSGATSLTADSSTFGLRSGAPSALSLVDKDPSPTVQPAAPFEGNPFSLNVRVLDPFGNLVPDATNSVTLSLDDSGVTPVEAQGVAVLGGTLTKDPLSGMISFTDLTVDKAASGFVVRASAPGLAGDSTNVFDVTLGTGPRTLVVDNVTGKPPSEGGNGLPNCPFESLAQALAEADNDPDVNIIEVVETGTDYPGDANLAAPGLTQTLTLRGRQGDNPRLLGQVTLGDGDTVQDLTIARNGAGECLLANGLMNGTVSNVVVENTGGPGAAFQGIVGTMSVSNLSSSSRDTGLTFSGLSTGVLSLNSCGFSTLAGTALDLTGGQLTGSGNSVDAVGGPALVTSGTSLAPGGVTFSRLTSANSTGVGVTISNMNAVSGSPVFAGGVTTVSNSLNSGIVVSGSNVNFDFGTCTVDSSAMAAGAGGIDLLTGNSGVSSFGVLQCSTNRFGLQVGAGGLRTTAPGGRIQATGGPGLICQGTSFDAAGVEFESVSSQGGALGISISDTGSGSLTIAGTGGGAADGSGGTLQAISGNAVVLLNCGNITLRSLNIGASGALGNIGANGIDAIGVDTLTLDGCAFLNVGTAAQAEGAIYTTDPEGTWTLRNCTFERSFREHFGIRNNSSTGNPTINVLNCSFVDSLSSGSGAESIFYFGNPGSNATVNVLGSQFQDSGRDHIRIANSAASAVTANIGGPNAGDGNTMRTLSGVTTGRDGVALDSKGTLNYLVQGNFIHGADAAIRTSASSSSTMTGQVVGNTIGTEGSVSSGIGLLFFGVDTGSNNFTASNNLVRQTSVGLQVEARDSSQIDGVVETNDLASSSDPVSNNGLVIRAGRSGVVVDTSTTCLDVRNNALESALSWDVSYFVQTGCALQLSGYVGPSTGATAVTAVNAFLIALNPGATQYSGTVDGTVADCP